MIYYETASTDPRINLAAEDYLLHQAGAEDVVIACGSLYMIGYAKQGFLREE